ncbi:ATPase [Serpentinicella sp. ANB-PHB4]|uniref:ATPase n=1 Tax=Serpentinicella sp. ANB-PHB4 TaxID=3074076 RepID=UPI00285EC945|nr:ATPase [Serpentinicella sp. ANB-PHB4]MDR5657952.1 ATPase [Serpentinicella sp. ANB-PHB4]
MRKKGQIKRLFPGGNTSVGFYSYYEYVIDVKKAKKVYYLKGGPGLGKSSMMKRIGQEMLNNGFNIELHHCSADPDSIDALVIPEIKTAFIDGTAPHTLDPKFPGAVEEIINLGEFWDEEGIRNNKDQIIRSIEDNGNIYKRVYKYLGAAKLIRDDIEWIHSNAVDKALLKEKSFEFINEIFKDAKKISKESTVRRLFGSAYTHKGHIDYAETFISENKKIYFIEGKIGTGRSDILDKILRRGIENGYDLEVYHEPLDPLKIEALIIKDLGVAITTNDKYDDSSFRMNINSFLKKDLLDKYEQGLDDSIEIYNQLLQDAMDTLKKAKENHDIIESYYIPNIRFELIDDLTTKLIKRVLEIKN